MEHLEDIHFGRFYRDLMDNAAFLFERIKGESADGVYKTYYDFDDCEDECESACPVEDEPNEELSNLITATENFDQEEEEDEDDDEDDVTPDEEGDSDSEEQEVSDNSGESSTFTPFNI